MSSNMLRSESTSSSLSLCSHSEFSSSKDTLQNSHMTCVKYFQFSAAVRCFNYYRKSWLPEPEKTINCFHEEGNTFDRFAIKVCEKDKNEIAGHLSIEISRVTKLLLERGPKVSAN